jgi:hypothetical protein
MSGASPWRKLQVIWSHRFVRSQLSARNPIEVNMAEPYVFPLVMPERSHAANETTFSADKQPKKRGRPRGSRNKMSPAMKAMIVEVIEELGRVDLEDWDKLPLGDGPKGHLKFLAVRDLKSFLRLVGRLLPPPRRPAVRRRPERPWMDPVAPKSRPAAGRTSQSAMQNCNGRHR